MIQIICLTGKKLYTLINLQAEISVIICHSEESCTSVEAREIALPMN